MDVAKQLADTSLFIYATDKQVRGREGRLEA